MDGKEGPVIIYQQRTYLRIKQYTTNFLSILTAFHHAYHCTRYFLALFDALSQTFFELYTVFGENQFPNI